MRFWFVSAALTLLLAAPAVAQQPACPFNERMPPARRASPLDSVSFTLGDAQLKVCYGRPSARGREMLGGQVPYGEIWRTGANETTKLYTPVALTIAGVEVPAGTYALYTVPGADEWEVVINRAWEQWGHERYYTDEVKAQEVGRGKVPTKPTAEPVETFTIAAEPHGADAVHLVLTWERHRVEIPVHGPGHKHEAGHRH